MRRIVVAAVVLLQAVAGSVVLGATSTSAEAAVACKKYTVIGVRGTDDGARASIGKQLPTAVNAFAAVAGRKNMTVDHVSYRANANYVASMQEGRAALIKKLNTYRSACGSKTKYVLFGYSQGAQVVGDVAVKHLVPAVKSQMHGIGLIGDPMFNPTLRGSKTGNKTYGGMWGRRKAWPSGVFVSNVCNKKDQVCASYSPAQSLGYVSRKFGTPYEHNYTTKTYSPVAGHTGAGYVGRSVALRR